MKYEMTGTIKHVKPVQEFASGFRKRVFILQTPDEKYPQEIAFELLKDNTGKVTDADIGVEASVKFDIRGREYNGQWYVSLAAWAVDKSNTSGPVDDSADKRHAESIEEKQDGLPF
jgi:single-strand DNA-binding protein